MVFSSVKVKDTLLVTRQNINELDEITLNYDQIFFSIEFSLLSFDRPEKNSYRYMLEGFDNSWKLAGNESTANYTDVREGDYTFRLKGTDRTFNVVENSIRLIVLPPWYRSKVAYLLYGLTLLSFIALLYWYQKHRWHLETQFQLKEQEAEQLKELGMIKTQLYANITHEFRMPLTIISGMARQMREQPKQWLEIAYEVGFKDPNYFTRVFTEEFGESPSRTRNYLVVSYLPKMFSMPFEQ